MVKRDIIVIGASAGGITALKELAAALPAQLPASIFIVQHISADAPSILPQILNYRSKLTASHPVDGEPIQPGHIYVAPPDHHILLEHDRVLVRKGPKENRFRPSIDVLFRSAAYAYGPRVIGIILTGLLNDGTSGMWSIKLLGGLSVIQRPDEALYPSMPESVQANVAVDYTVSVSQLATLLSELTQQSAGERPDLSLEEEHRIKTEVTIAEQDSAFEMNFLEQGKLTPLTCPECHGSLISIQEGTLIRYRCHTGHAFTAGSLLAGVTHTIEESLWSAIRSLEETVMLLENAAHAFEEGGNEQAAGEYRAKSVEAHERIHKLRKLILEGQ